MDNRAPQLEARGSLFISLPDGERGFARRRHVNSERVDAAGELGCKRRVDHAMTFNAALSAEGFRYDIEPEMSLAAGPVSRMALVLVGFILDLQALGRKSIAQLFCDQFACPHGAL
jgi:hypothetical protein